MEKEYQALLAIVKKNKFIKNDEALRKSLNLCSRLYTRAKQEEYDGYYTKMFIDESIKFRNKIKRIQ